MEQNTFGFVDTRSGYPQFLQIYDFGIENRRDEIYDFSNQNRKNYGGYLFQCTLDGEGIFTYEGKDYKMSKGGAFFIPIPHKSRYYLPKESSHWHFFFLHFDGKFVESFYEYVFRKHTNAFYLPSEASCISLFLKEYREVSGGKTYHSFENGAFLYSFLEAVCADLQRPADFKNQTWVEAAKEWMQKNYATGKNITDMSKEIKVSTSHLTRQFHLQTGMTPTQYFMKLKMEHAMFLLLNTNLLIFEIALQVGFTNGNYFSKVFRRFLQMSPQEYRSLHIGTNPSFDIDS